MESTPVSARDQPGRTRSNVDTGIVLGLWTLGRHSTDPLSIVNWMGCQSTHRIKRQSGHGLKAFALNLSRSKPHCVTDARTLMVRSMNGNLGMERERGQSDYLIFQRDGQRVSHVGMQADYQRQGCLTKPPGSIGVRHPPTGFSQHFSQHSNWTHATTKAGLSFSRPLPISKSTRAQTRSGQSIRTHPRVRSHNRTEATQETQVSKRCRMGIDDTEQSSKKGAVFTCRFVVREWKAKLGGKAANPWITEHFLPSKECTSMDLVPPPSLTRLLPGDFVQATIEHVILPIHADDDYGPRQQSSSCLKLESQFLTDNSSSSKRKSAKCKSNNWTTHWPVPCHPNPCRKWKGSFHIFRRSWVRSCHHP